VCAHPLICLPPGTGIRTAFDDACAAQGVRADVALQATAPDAVADLAARGMGVGILSESIARAVGPALDARVIADLTTPALLALVWRGAAGPALRELLVHAHAAFGIASGRDAKATATAAPLPRPVRGTRR
jgi:DNA-binding transcriptional LysR family regulator